MNIKQRMSIPGGACEFDLPSYHYWLCQPQEYRHQDFKVWIEPLIPIREGFKIVLMLLRNSGRTFHYIAKQGQFQHAGSDHTAHDTAQNRRKFTLCARN